MNNKVSLGAILLFSLTTGCGGGSNKSPPIIMCEWDPTIPANDPACVAPPVVCDVTLTWTNPTHREVNANGVKVLLEPTDLAKLTIYAGRIPNAPDNELAFVMDVSEVYSLMWTMADIESGVWWFGATVTDTLDQESNRSNETSKVCE